MEATGEVLLDVVLAAPLRFGTEITSFQVLMNSRGRGLSAVKKRPPKYNRRVHAALLFD